MCLALWYVRCHPGTVLACLPSPKNTLGGQKLVPCTLWAQSGNRTCEVHFREGVAAPEGPGSPAEDVPTGRA